MKVEVPDPVIQCIAKYDSEQHYTANENYLPCITVGGKEVWVGTKHYYYEEDAEQEAIEKLATLFEKFLS